MKMPKASIIVATYNRAYLLKYCLKQLLNQTTNDHEIIVVDDGSTDGSQGVLQNFIHAKKVRYIRNEIRQGPSFARNLGIKEARGEIIIFVDSDVMVGLKFVDDHITLHKKSDRLIVQGLVRHIRHPKDIGRLSLKIDGLSIGGLVTQNVSIRKQWLETVELIDEKFGITMGYEDTDLGRRLRSIGLKTVFGLRKCVAYHVDGYPTREKIESSFQKRYQWSKNIVYFGSKHGKQFVKANKVFTISKIFQTERWVEKEAAIRLLLNNIDSPIIFIVPILKEIMKYHYRAKGILEAQNEKTRSQK